VSTIVVRHAHPSDYGRVIQHVNAWWDDRAMAPALPKLFFVHFESTSLVAETEEGALVGFLVGFLSQTHPEEAFVHFVGVAPEHRGRGVGRDLYEAFFEAARAHGRTVVHAVALPSDEAAMSFHRSLGFEPEAVEEDAGEPRVLLARRL
jgi:ribosomal protein S18 acetylase RimI-like enzyme